MPAITRKETRLKLQFVANTDHSLHAGLVAGEALTRRFRWWDQVRALHRLDAQGPEAWLLEATGKSQAAAEQGGGK